MVFTKDDYNVFATKCGVVGFFPSKRTLASGRESHWYWNGRRFSDYGINLDALVEYILGFCKDDGLRPDYFVNVPEGVNIVTCALNRDLGGKQVMARAKPKEHGDPKDRLFIGDVKEGDRVIVFEDVTTTGQSLYEEIKKCREAGLEVIATLCECNRMERAAKGKGEERADMNIGVAVYIEREFGIPHYSMTDATSILPVAFGLWSPPEGVSKRSIADGLRAEYEDHGIVPMELEV
jgi:orotate phosphoribosyltransferase